MREKVIFDTNTIRNPDNDEFLGGRKELELFSKYADILIPDIVIQEIRRQKKSTLKKHRNQRLSNPFLTLVGVNKDDIKAFDIDDYIQQLVDNEKIPYEVIDNTDNNILPQIKKLAIYKQAPFEGSDKTDKGFKDALVYFTILEYMQKDSNKDVFVCTKDELLKEALCKHPEITVVEDYEEFKIHSISQFSDDYFIEKINSELITNITEENIIEYWRNFNYNFNVRIKTDEKEYIVEVDSGEIIGSSQPDFYTSNIENLINSNSFATTHSLIEELSPYTSYFSDDEILRILDASYTNNQIKWIIDDEDVMSFIGTLFNSKKELVGNETSLFLKDNFK